MGFQKELPRETLREEWTEQKKESWREVDWAVKMECSSGYQTVQLWAMLMVLLTEE